MLIKPITYTNYNGEKRTKNFYFNLSATELSKMEFFEKAGMEAAIKEMVNTDDRKRIIELFEQIVLTAYGEKSEDGEEFIKNDLVRERFKCHPAYDVLFMELLSSDKAMSDFLNAIIPQSFADEIKKQPNKTLNDIMGYEAIPGANIVPGPGSETK